MSDNIFNKIREQAPTDELCSKDITLDIVGDRCVYLNDHRIVGGKPYASEALQTKTKKLTVREALEAFSVKELQAAITERKERAAYYHGYRTTRDEIGADV